MSYWILSIAITAVLAISFATYRFVNLHSAIIIFIPLMTALLATWNIHSSSSKEKNKDKPNPSFQNQSWFTKQRLFYASYLGLIGLLIGAEWYVFSSYGLSDWKTWCMVVGLLVAFGFACYYLYFWFYPTYFWRRGVLSKKQWNSVVDCRDGSEFIKGHYEGAIHWPISTLTHQNVFDRIKELKSPVLVYDNTGETSRKWKSQFDLIANEMQLEGFVIAYTDAHWTQIPINA